MYILLCRLSYHYDAAEGDWSIDFIYRQYQEADLALNSPEGLPCAC